LVRRGEPDAGWPERAGARRSILYHRSGGPRSNQWLSETTPDGRWTGRGQLEIDELMNFANAVVTDGPMTTKASE
jgi:hypothetical protein